MFYQCPQCNQIFFRKDDNQQNICNTCQNRILDKIEGRFILRCRKCGLTQSKSAMKAMGGTNPLHCQSPTCNGPIKAIYLGEGRKNHIQKLRDQKQPPKPTLQAFKHPKVPQRRRLESPAATLSETLSQKKKKPLPKNDFTPFPTQEGKSSGIYSNLIKDHPGLKENDILKFEDTKYEVTSRLGTGGMGAVWKGRNLKNNKPVAIKEFYYTRFHDPETGKNFCEKYWNREKRITNLQSQSPEHCMHYIGALKLTEYDIPEYYILLEYIEGELLDTWYNRQYPDMENLSLPVLQMFIKDILMPLARHMYFVHNFKQEEQKGIVHRDLTVQNIMIKTIHKEDYQDSYVPIIIDWGVAKEVNNMYNPRKPYYISSTPEATGIRNRGTPPEVMAGFEPIAATDIYMLGHIMFYLFSGGHYAGSAATNEDFVLHPADFNPNLPAEFNQLVEYMTQYEPADRMENMVKVYDALEWLYNHIESTIHVTTDQQTKKQYYLYCDYNEGLIPLPENQIIKIGRDEVIKAGQSHDMDGHLYNALISTSDDKYAFQIYIENEYAYIQDKFSKLGTFISNLTATNQQIYQDIPIKGLDNACILLSPENLGKATIEVPFIAPDGKTYRIQFMIVKK